jgi:hypothetical protein
MASNDPPDDAAIPQPLYSCSDDECSAEHSWRAHDLHWVPIWGGWYCDECIDGRGYAEGISVVETGPSLQEWLDRQL